MDRKATERVYAGGKDTERVEDGPDITGDGSTRSGSGDGRGHVREDNRKSGGGRRSFGGVRGQEWTEAGQRVEPAAVHSSTGPHQKLLYADDLALVTNGKQELQETMEEWNGLFIKHGLKLNLEKTEVLHIGHQREELDIELDGKILNQRDSVVYLGGAVCGDGKTEREVRRRVQAGANAWRAVEGVMADRRISKRLKGKVMSNCVTPACLYGTETLALTELQQHRRQVCENNWVRKIARVTRADRRRMVELREETGVQRSLTERLVRNRLQWAGHVERMADERLPKRAAELREHGGQY